MKTMKEVRDVIRCCRKYIEYFDGWLVSPQVYFDPYQTERCIQCELLRFGCVNSPFTIWPWTNLRLASEESIKQRRDSLINIIEEIKNHSPIATMEPNFHNLEIDLLADRWMLGEIPFEALNIRSVNTV